MLKTVRKIRRAPGILALALLALLPLLAVQCTVKKPVAPSWSTILNIPLVSRIMDMRYIVSKDTTHLSIVGDTVMLAMGKPLNPVRVGDNLKFNASLSTSLGLSDAVLQNQTQSDSIPRTNVISFYRDMYDSGYVGANDTLVRFVNDTLKPVSLQRYPLNTMQFVRFGFILTHTITINVTFRNYFPCALRQVYVTLENNIPMHHEVLGVATIGDVAPQSSVTAAVTINSAGGQYIASTIQPYLRCTVDGTPGAVTINDTTSSVMPPTAQVMYFTYALGPGAINFIAGTALIDSQSVGGGDTLQGMTRIKTCTFASGAINLNIDNNLYRVDGSPVNGLLSYSLPQFRHVATGLPLTGSLNISSGISTQAIPISQYRFISDTLSGPDTIATKKLKYHFLFEPTSSPVFVRIDSSSYVHGSFTFNPQLVIDRFEGVLDTLRANIPALTQNLNMNAAADSMHVTFTHPEMRLNLSSSFSNIKGRFHLEFRGYTRTGSLIPVSLVLEDTLHYNNYALPSLFRDNNAGGSPTNLATFLSYFPNVIESDVTNSFFYIQTASSAGNAVSRVSRTDSVTGSFTFETPFYITMQASGMYPNPDSVGIGKNDNLQFISGGISYEFRNHLPLGIDSIVVYAGTRKSLVDSCRRYNFADTGVVRIGTISMPAAPVGSDGLTSGEAPLARGTITLNQRQLDLFRNTTDNKKYVFLAAKIRLPGTGGSQVLVRGSDYINMKVLATINTMIINK